jgi:hypothetical protein
MSKKLSTFDRAVSSICSAARRRISSKGTVSAVDLSSIAPSITGNSRGAAVRAAFRSLEDEKFMCRTSDTVYNPSTRHRVAVYKTA